MEQLTHALSKVLGQEVTSIDFFTSGQIGDIYKIHTAEQNDYILKTSEPSQNLQVEADMLHDLHSYDIRVPKVYDVTSTHLLMEDITPHNQAKCTQEIEAAKLLTKLHSISNDDRMYGYYYNTTIGPFTQNNEQTQYSWGVVPSTDAHTTYGKSLL